MMLIENVKQRIMLVFESYNFDGKKEVLNFTQNGEEMQVNVIPKKIPFGEKELMNRVEQYTGDKF